MTKKQMIIMEKMKKIIGKERRKMYPIKEIEIENATIKNITQATASYGAQEGRLIGMLTITFGRKKYDRILSDDYLSTIKRKTIRMYHSSLYFIDYLKKSLNKKGYDFIYLGAFELQKDGTLHMHIYFSIPVKGFGYYLMHIITTIIRLLLTQL